MKIKKLWIIFGILSTLTIAGTCKIAYDIAVYTARGPKPDTRDYVLVTNDYIPETVVSSADVQIFYLGASYGKVVIYNEDKTVYDYTDIELSGLPRNLQIEILNGFKINSMQQLYDFLEAYSS